MPSYSPIKLGTSRPAWVLAADYVCNSGSQTAPIYRVDGTNGIPHQRGNRGYPDGANNLNADGSVHWVTFEKLLYLTTWQYNAGACFLFLSIGSPAHSANGRGLCLIPDRCRQEDLEVAFVRRARFSNGIRLGVCLGLILYQSLFADSPARDQFHPGEVWMDDHGVPINAHGGGILLHNGIYYWFGEHKIQGDGRQ